MVKHSDTSKGGNKAERLSREQAVDFRENGVRQMLSFQQVLSTIPLSRSTIERMIKNGTFPKPRLLTPMKIGFYVDEIVDWQRSLDKPDS